MRRVTIDTVFREIGMLKNKWALFVHMTTRAHIFDIQAPKVMVLC